MLGRHGLHHRSAGGRRRRQHSNQQGGDGFAPGVPGRQCCGSCSFAGRRSGCSHCRRAALDSPPRGGAKRPCSMCGCPGSSTWRRPGGREPRPAYRAAAGSNAWICRLCGGPAAGGRQCSGQAGHRSPARCRQHRQRGMPCGLGNRRRRLGGIGRGEARGPTGGSHVWASGMRGHSAVGWSQPECYGRHQQRIDAAALCGLQRRCSMRGSPAGKWCQRAVRGQIRAHTPHVGTAGRPCRSCRPAPACGSQRRPCTGPAWR